MIKLEKVKGSSRKAYLQKWARLYIARDIKDGVSGEIIMKLYNLTPTQYRNLLKFLNNLPKHYFKRLVPLNQGQCFKLYDDFSCGKSEIELCELYDLTLDEVVDAIEVGENLDKELKFNKEGLLNTLIPEKLTDEQKEIRKLEEMAKKKLNRISI